MIPRRIERDTAFLVARGAARQHVRQAGLDELAVVPGDRISVHGVISIERATEGEAGYRDERVAIRLVDHPAHRLTLGKAR